MTQPKSLVYITMRDALVTLSQEEAEQLFLETNRLRSKKATKFQYSLIMNFIIKKNLRIKS